MGKTVILADASWTLEQRRLVKRKEGMICLLSFDPHFKPSNYTNPSHSIGLP